MRIACYYEPAGVDPGPEMVMVEKWRTAWEAIGWGTMVLSNRHAKRHPNYEQMAQKADSLPHVTDSFYHRHNFLRWLAFAQIGGVVSEYDVFPQSQFVFEPTEKAINGSLTLTPGFISAPKEWMEALCRVMLDYEVKPTDTHKGALHACDMEIIRRNPGMFDNVRDFVRVINEPGWKTAPLVHFANAAIRHRYQVVSAIFEP